MISVSTTRMASFRAARRAAITAGSSGSVGGFGAGLPVGATGGEETGRGACMAVAGFAVVCSAVTDFAVATGLGYATAALPADGATAAFATGRLRITTTGLLFESCERSGIVVFFLLRPGKSILTAPRSPAVVSVGTIIFSPCSPRASPRQCVACDQSSFHLIPPQ